MTDYEFADGWYANQSMRANYKSHVIEYYAYCESIGKQPN
jgi:hypothetical protein